MITIAITSAIGSTSASTSTITIIHCCGSIHTSTPTTVDCILCISTIIIDSSSGNSTIGTNHSSSSIYRCVYSGVGGRIGIGIG